HRADGMVPAAPVPPAWGAPPPTASAAPPPVSAWAAPGDPLPAPPAGGGPVPPGPPWSGAPAPPPRGPQRSPARTILLVVGAVTGAWLAIVVVCVLAVTLLGSNAEDQFTVIEPGTEAPGTQEQLPAPGTPWTELAGLLVGDCTEADLGSADVIDPEQTMAMSCAEPHRSELFLVEPVEGGDAFPGDAAVQAAVDEACYGSGYR
ncbi:hypothetical protein B7486_73190, partial [cyanobacterium TDX16]